MKFAPKIAVLAAVVIVPVGVALASTALANSPEPPSFEPRVTFGVATPEPAGDTTALPAAPMATESAPAAPPATSSPQAPPAPAAPQSIVVPAPAPVEVFPDWDDDDESDDSGDDGEGDDG